MQETSQGLLCTCEARSQLGNCMLGPSHKTPQRNPMHGSQELPCACTACNLLAKCILGASKGFHYTKLGLKGLQSPGHATQRFEALLGI